MQQQRQLAGTTRASGGGAQQFSAAATAPIKSQLRTRMQPQQGNVQRRIVTYQRKKGGERRRRVSPTTDKDSVVISRAELDYIARSANIETAADRANAAAANKDRVMKQAARARAHKQRMLAMEEETRRRAPALTQSETQQLAQRNSLLYHAKERLDEELDDVKHMNQMMLYAKCVTIRDQQIIEKKRIREATVEEERRLDKAMEVERIKEQRIFDDRERTRSLELRKGKAIIVSQMEERQKRRERQAEIRDQEAQAMVQRIKELEKKEEEEKQRKLVAGRQLLEQVMRANNAQAQAKLLRKQDEIDEDMRIAEYLRQKDLRDQAQEEELERIAAEKELEVARLRALQEKAQDRQSEIDELRAKRYQEAKDREWRQEQLRQAKKRERMKQEIQQARVEQRAEKERRMAEQALQERKEYHRVLDWQRAQIQDDRAREQEAVLATEEYRDALLSQIAKHEADRSRARREMLDEGKIITMQMQNEKAKLLAIKQRKLAALAKAGVPEQYRAQLAKKKMLQSNPFI